MILKVAFWALNAQVFPAIRRIEGEQVAEQAAVLTLVMKSPRCRLCLFFCFVIASFGQYRPVP